MTPQDARSRVEFARLIKTSDARATLLAFPRYRRGDISARFAMTRDSAIAICAPAEGRFRHAGAGAAFRPPPPFYFIWRLFN